MSTDQPTPREAASLPAEDLATWIVDRIEGPTSSRIRAGLHDDIEAAIGYRDHARATVAPTDQAGPASELAEVADEQVRARYEAKYPLSVDTDDDVRALLYLAQSLGLVLAERRHGDIEDDRCPGCGLVVELDWTRIVPPHDDQSDALCEAIGAKVPGRPAPQPAPAEPASDDLRAALEAAMYDELTRGQVGTQPAGLTQMLMDQAKRMANAALRALADDGDQEGQR